MEKITIAMPEPAAVAGSTLKNGWRLEQGAKSLPEVHGTIIVPQHGHKWRKLAAFAGPGYLVAVGYMDPGNWATSIAGGSRFGYTLLVVALVSNIMAVLLQSLCTRLAVATGRDLAQACRDAYAPWVAWLLWIGAEIAICATDLAEVIGTAIALNLLFNMPLEIGVVLTALDVFVVLYMQSKGFRWVEAYVIALLGIISVCFFLQIMLADPDWGAVLRGFAPTTDIVTNPEMLYLSLGIIGATVMPHNLYLHSGIIQTRNYGTSEQEKREAITYSTWDSTLALTLALLINASILILAAATFHKVGRIDVVEIEQAEALLTPLLGSAIAPVLFAVALLCSGLNSTVTATMAGQIVMEGFIHFRLQPWLRRLITRGLAIVPTIIVTLIYGNKGTASLLILSQVVLSLQLPFAIVPLILFTADAKKMGRLRAPLWLSLLAWLVAIVVIALNLKLIYDVATGAA